MKKKSFRMKKIHIKVLTILSAVLITAMTATLPVSAKTTKIFKPVSEENAERNSAEAEANVNQEDNNNKSKSVKKQNTRKKAAEENITETKSTTEEEPIETVSPESEKTEVPETETESHEEEPVYVVLTDIRCILIGILMISGFIAGVVLSHSFERGIKN